MVFRGRKDLRKHNAELHCGKCRIQCFWNLTYPRFENSGKSSAIFDPYVFVCLKSASCESSSFYCVQYYTVWWVLAYKTLWSGQQPRWKKQHRCSHQRDQHMLCIGAGFGAGLCWGGFQHLDCKPFIFGQCSEGHSQREMLFLFVHHYNCLLSQRPKQTWLL